jgi:hypothetical protein
LGPQIFSGLAPDASTQQQARAAYLAICLGLADSLKKDYAERWPEFLASLQQYPQLLDVLFSGPVGPAGDRLRNAAAAAGLKKSKQ